MSRSYDIVDRLRSKNEKPNIKFDENAAFAVNTEYKNVMALMAVGKEANEENDPEKEIAKMKKIIKIALGSKAVSYVEENEFTFSALLLVVEAIYSAVGDTDLEDEKKPGKKGKK